MLSPKGTAEKILKTFGNDRLVDAQRVKVNRERTSKEYLKPELDALKEEGSSSVDDQASVEEAEQAPGEKAATPPGADARRSSPFQIVSSAQRGRTAMT